MRTIPLSVAFVLVVLLIGSSVVFAQAPAPSGGVGQGGMMQMMGMMQQMGGMMKQMSGMMERMAEMRKRMSGILGSK